MAASVGKRPRLLDFEVEKEARKATIRLYAAETAIDDYNLMYTGGEFTYFPSVTLLKSMQWWNNWENVYQAITDHYFPPAHHRVYSHGYAHGLGSQRLVHIHIVLPEPDYRVVPRMGEDIFKTFGVKSPEIPFNQPLLPMPDDIHIISLMQAAGGNLVEHVPLGSNSQFSEKKPITEVQVQERVTNAMRSVVSAIMERRRITTEVLLEHTSLPTTVIETVISPFILYQRQRAAVRRPSLSRFSS